MNEKKSKGKCMGCQKELIELLNGKKAVIGVVGLGYVGLPLMLRYNEVGFSVLGIDVDKNKVDKLNSGESYIEHISEERIKKASDSGFEATVDFSRVSELDAIILCVPTPLNKYREPDISYVIDTIESMIPYLRKGQVVSLESTTYPGTTEEELFPRIQESGLQVGKDIFLVYSPEREDPGNKDFETQAIPKIVGGHTVECKNVGVALYEKAIDKIVTLSSTKAAEMTKLLENIHRAVNIGLVNEMKVVADKMGIDIFEVVDAAATKPFGFTPYYPGPGLGGHCIPIDPFYLTWKAREYGIHTRFIELSGEVNRAMPYYVVDKLVGGMNDVGKPLKDSHILVLGIAYKKNVGDVRESPSIAIMELLRDKKANVAYSDPYFPAFPKMRNHYFDLTSVPLTKENLKKFDAIILATEHDAFDLKFLQENAKLIVDARGKYRNNESNVIRA